MTFLSAPRASRALPVLALTLLLAPAVLFAAPVAEGLAAGDASYARGALAGRIERTAAHLSHSQLARLESYLPFLATTGNITPFVGLLGTVMGIIDAFREIGAQGTASIAAVAPGVAEALIATAAGLFTAIPAVIAYNYFLSRIRRTAFRLDTVTIELMTSLSVPVVKATPIPVGAQR